MSDYGDFCREQRAHKQDVKRRQAAENFRFVEQMIALGFTEYPLSGGLRFTSRDKLRIDFWPSSGKWTVVGSNEYRTGPAKMVHYAKARSTKEGKVETVIAKPKDQWKSHPTGEGNPPWKI